MKENLCKKCNFYTADPDCGICDACLEMSYFDDEEKINCLLEIGTNLNKDFCKNKFTEELIGEVFKKEKENETYN